MRDELAYRVGFHDGFHDTESFGYDFTPAENKHRRRGYLDGVKAQMEAVEYPNEASRA